MAVSVGRYNLACRMNDTSRETAKKMGLPETHEVIPPHGGRLPGLGRAEIRMPNRLLVLSSWVEASSRLAISNR